MNREEAKKIERIAKVSLYAAGPNSEMVKYTFKVVQRYLVNGSVLEMGPAEGLMTELLVATGRKVTVVEGSHLFCRKLRERFPELDIVHSLFEEFNPEDLYDNIILGHVLEHVKDPVSILSKAKHWLRPVSGRLFAAVPNAKSLHRQAAVIMGILPREDSLNEMDIHHGHRRVFNPESFRDIFHQAGLKIKTFGGYWMKPLSNRQIEENWTPQMLDAFMQIGERYPDIAGEIFIIANHE